MIFTSNKHAKGHQECCGLPECKRYLARERQKKYYKKHSTNEEWVKNQRDRKKKERNKRGKNKKKKGRLIESPEKCEKPFESPVIYGILFAALLVEKKHITHAFGLTLRAADQ